MSTCIKHTVQALLLGLFCLTLSISLIACSGGIDTDEAKVFIEDFIAAVEAEDHEKAQEFMHPDRPADLELFFIDVQSAEEIDFSSGIEIEDYKNFSYSYYHSEVKGSRFEVTIETIISDKPVEFVIELVKNDAGYGIYNFEINT